MKENYLKTWRSFRLHVQIQLALEYILGGPLANGRLHFMSWNMSHAIVVSESQQKLKTCTWCRHTWLSVAVGELFVLSRVTAFYLRNSRGPFRVRSVIGASSFNFCEQHVFECSQFSRPAWDNLGPVRGLSPLWNRVRGHRCSHRYNHLRLSYSNWLNKLWK